MPAASATTTVSASGSTARSDSSMSASHARPSAQIVSSIAAIRSKSALAVTSVSVTPSGKPWRPGDRSHGRDHHRLLLFRLEPGGDQPLGKISRQVVGEVLPLEPRAALGEGAHLARDQLVQLGAVEAAEVAESRSRRSPALSTAEAGRPVRA